MYQVCTCPQSNLTSGDPRCPVHGKQPESVMVSWCESCASLAARVKELEEEVARKTAECIAFFDDGVEKGLRIKQLESIAKQVIHCETCGGTWYDGGLTSSCPSCRIHTLEKVVEAARVFIDEIDNGLISGTHDRRAYFIHNLRVALKEVGK